MPAPLQLEDIAGEVGESTDLHYWNKLLEISKKAPLDGTDLTNRNLLNSLNTSVEGSSGLMSKIKSLRESIPDIKRELGVVPEDEDMSDSFRTPPGSRAPLRTGAETQSSVSSRAGPSSTKRPSDVQTVASSLINLATSGKGQVDPRLEVTPEIVGEVLSQLQQEPNAEDIVDFIRRVKGNSGKSSAKSSERLTTWLSEKRMRNSELEHKLRESQMEESQLRSELQRLQTKTDVVKKAIRELHELMTEMKERCQEDRQKRERITEEVRESGEILVLKKALQESEKQLTEVQSQLDRKRQHTLELELKLSQLQAVSTVAVQTDSDQEAQRLETQTAEMCDKLAQKMRILDQIQHEYDQKVHQNSRIQELDAQLQAEQTRVSGLKQVLRELAERAAQALVSNR